MSVPPGVRDTHTFKVAPLSGIEFEYEVVIQETLPEVIVALDLSGTASVFPIGIIKYCVSMPAVPASPKLLL